MESEYQVVLLPNGEFSIRSLAEGETFHPVAGPTTEATRLYVEQLRLAARMQAHAKEFVIWDVGLGAAGNICATLRATRQVEARLRIVSFDRTSTALRFALTHANELSFLNGYAHTTTTLLEKGNVRFQNGRQDVTWEIQITDFPELIAGSARAIRRGGHSPFPAPHAIFYDAYSPARNPEMWTLDVFRDLHTCVDPRRECGLATFSRSTMVRTAMLLAGFFVGIGASVKAKEETTVAANRPELVPALLPTMWLARALKSAAAEPLRAREYVRAPLSEGTWRELQAHPQFRQAAAQS